jgi:hypothetical protein
MSDFSEWENEVSSSLIYTGKELLGLFPFTKQGQILQLVVKTILIIPRGQIYKQNHITMVWPIHKMGFGHT